MQLKLRAFRAPTFHCETVYLYESFLNIQNIENVPIKVTSQNLTMEAKTD